jgi:endonuclease YncB( thermonuclease family)
MLCEERAAHATCAGVPRSSWAKHALFGVYVDAYDGDTCRLALTFPRGNGDVAVRMLGYDAPEMKKDHRPFGTEVRDVLRNIVLDNEIPPTRTVASWRGYTLPPFPRPRAAHAAHLAAALCCCAPRLVRRLL